MMEIQSVCCHSAKCTIKLKELNRKTRYSALAKRRCCRFIYPVFINVMALFILLTGCFISYCSAEEWLRNTYKSRYVFYKPLSYVHKINYMIPDVLE